MFHSYYRWFFGRRQRWACAALGMAVLGVAALDSPPARAFRPNLNYGHRGITQRALDRFSFPDPESNGMPVGFTRAARDRVVLANEETDILGSLRALECFLDVSAEERAMPPFFVTPFHCDDDKIGECSRVVREGLDTVITTVMSGNVDKARACLGRIMHTVQDFHAHSTLVWKLFRGDQSFYRPPLSDDYGRAERDGLFDGTLPMSSQVIGSAYGSDVCTGSVQRVDPPPLIPTPFGGLPLPLPPTTRQQYTGHVQGPRNPDTFPLTSGYFPNFASITFPTTEVPLPNVFEAWSVVAFRWEPPLRRCGHGVRTPPDIQAALAGKVLAPGMAKDDLNLPERWQHDAAKELAETATLRLVERVRDAVQARLAANPTAYSQFMREFLGHAPIANTNILGSIGAAIDLSTSMEPVLAGIRDSVNQFADTAEVAAAGDPTLVLVGYADPLIGEPIIARDREIFRNELNLLQVGQLGPGGDCPERTIAALQRVVEELPENSRAFAFTNASSKDIERESLLVASAQEKNISIDINVSGSCSPIDPAFKRITEATGGQLLQTEANDSTGPGQIMAAELENLVAGRQQLITRVSRTVGAEERIEFPVDSSVRRLSVSIDMSGTEIVAGETAQKGVLTLLDPDGQPVPALVEGLVGNVYGVAEPTPGIWALTLSQALGQDFTLVVRGTSELALSDVSFAEEQGRIGHTGVMRTAARPVPNVLTALMAHFDEEGASELEFRLVTLDGTSSSPFEVAPDPELSGLIGSVVPLSEPFRVSVTGRRADGSAFQRLYPKVFASSPYRIVAVEDGAIFVPGQRHTMSFQVFNFGEPALLGVQASGTVDAEFQSDPPELELGTGETRTVNVTIDMPDGVLAEEFVRITARVGAVDDPKSENSVQTIHLIDEDMDGDGIASLLEHGPLGEEPRFDGNEDGEPDDLQSNVLSSPLFASQYATLELPDTVEATELRQDQVPLTAPIPPEAIIPLGAFRFSASVGSRARNFSLHLGGNAAYQVNRLYLATSDGSVWLSRGNYDQRTRILSFELTDAELVDLDAREGSISILAAPGFSVLDEPVAEEENGCLCRLPGGAPGRSSPWGMSSGLGLFAVWWVARQRRRRR